MSTRNERLNKSMISLEDFIEKRSINIEKTKLFSDNGEGVARMFDEIEERERSENSKIAEQKISTLSRPDCLSCDSCGNCDYCKIASAILLLIALGQGRLAPTFVEIVKNISNRGESIASLAKYHAK